MITTAIEEISFSMFQHTSLPFVIVPEDPLIKQPHKKRTGTSNMLMVGVDRLSALSLVQDS